MSAPDRSASFETESLFSATLAESDPEIADLIAQGRLLDLLQNPLVIDVANDPVLAQRIRKFDIQRALDYALEHDSSKR